MKTRTRNFLIAGGVVAAVLVALIGIGMYSIYSFFSRISSDRPLPPELVEARITTGAEFLTRTEFFKLERNGFLKTIGEGTKIPDERERERTMRAQTARSFYNFSDLKVMDDSVVAVGEFGGFVFDLNGNLKKQIQFELSTHRIKVGPFEKETYQSNLDNLQIVRLDADNIGFLSFGSIQGVRVFDSEGSEVWSIGKELIDLGKLIGDREKEYEESSNVLEAAVGDIDGDGISEYIVAKKNDGIRAYDRIGKEKWFQPDEFPSHKLQVFDIDQDGKNELLEIGKAVRDGKGNIIRKLEIKGDAIVFAADKKKVNIQSVDFYEGQLTLRQEPGETVFSVTAPLSEIKKTPTKVDVPGHPEMSYTDDSDNVAFPKAALVTLHASKPKYLAVIASFIGLPRSNFYIYDANGILVYHELLPEDAETIAVLANKDGSEQILIGGKDTIWKYAAN